MSDQDVPMVSPTPSSEEGEELVDLRANDSEDDSSEAGAQDAKLPPLPVGVPPEGGAVFERSLVDKVVARDNSLKPDQTWYLISHRWLEEWKRYAKFTAKDSYDYESDDEDPDFPADDHPRPGPIPNRDLLNDSGFQRRRMQESLDFNIIHEDLWKMFFEWYGGGPALPRKVIATGWRRGQYVVEVRPLHVKVMHYDTPDSFEMFLFSKTAKIKQMRDEICKKWEKDPKRIRMWDFHERSRIKLLADGQESLDEAQIIDGQYILVEEKDAKGKWPKVTKKSSSRYDAFADPTDPGCVGLNNLGNTCFMNSSLQCLSNTPPLVNYLLDGRYRTDLNKDNPLGTGGDLVGEYTTLVKGMWSGSRRAIAPREFKYTLERFAPQFAGYSQHDSQELLAFLLDGIHEDLNRIRKKPYVESVEGGDRPDDIVAAEAWQGHCLRNDSVVVDWFQGQLKSTVACPDCPRISITFDPFMYLSLPLPMKMTREVAVKLVYYDPAVPPRKFKLVIPKHGQVSEMAAVLAAQTGLGEDEFFFCEIYGSRFFRMISHKGQLSSVRDRDDTCAYQLVPAVMPKPKTPPPRPERLDLKAKEKSSPEDEDVGEADAEPDQNTNADPSNENAMEAGSDEAVRGSDGSDGEGDTNWSDDDVEDDDDTQWTGTSATYDPDRASYTPRPGPVTCKLLNRKEEVVTYTSYYRTSTYLRKTLFGLPLALCIRNDITYEELYRAVLERIQRFLKPAEEVVNDDDKGAEGAEDDEANSAKDAESAEGSDEAVKTGGDGTSSEGGADDNGTNTGEEVAEDGSDDENEEETAAPEPAEPEDPRMGLIDGVKPLFLIRATDSSCLHETKTLVNDGQPLMLRDNQTLALCWTDEALGRYDMEEAKLFEEDESMSAEDESGDDKITIGKCLDMFTNPEILGKDDMWYCSKCGDFKQAKKKFDIWRAPRVLIVHLKRFSYRNRYWREKIDSFVDYPLEDLDLSDHIMGKWDIPPLYDLYAVSNHFGSLGGGHYTAFAKNHKLNKWFRFDDSSVHEVAPEEARTSAAYMLFYRRKDTLESEPQITTAEGRATDPLKSDSEAEEEEEDEESDEGAVGFSSSDEINQGSDDLDVEGVSSDNENGVAGAASGGEDDGHEV